MVLNKRDLEKAFSPKNKSRKVLKIGHGNQGIKAKPGTSSNIKVCVRVRPLSETEESQNKKNTIRIIDEKMLVFDPKEETESFFFHGVKQKSRDIAKRPSKEMQFVFDRVFGPEANNQSVYDNSTEGIISTLLEGYNCSVFVYGATGAGKTHTMLGNKENPGITFLTMTELYRQVDELSATKDIEIGITYLEVYNENVQDLINPSGPMHLRDDSNGGIVVAGLKVEKILCADQLFQLLQKGNSNRTQHPTDANAESSRSHAVFQVYVKSQNKSSGEVKYGKLSMIDLAGSERGAATGCAGARFKEGSNINKSLLALGNCINNLADGLRHIPYRDSKLTRLLKDSLGGNCKTVMIANVSPSFPSYEDTYNTLKYATRAKSIKSQLTNNVMSVNLRVEHYVNMCNNLKKENAVLQTQVKALEQALKHPPVSPPRADPTYVAKLSDLYKEKKQLHVEWLNLEAQFKLLQWRIRCKTLAANQMKIQMAQRGADFQQELAKNEQSLLQLEGRAKSVMEKMTELSYAKNKHNEKHMKFTEEMEEAKVVKLLQNEANLKELQCTVAGMEIQQLHLKQIINMQDRRLEDQQFLNDSLTKICSEYYLILRGRELVTDSMDREYQGVQKTKGLKAVTWIDIEDNSDNEEGITLSSLSAKPFANLSLSLHSCSLPFVPEINQELTTTVPTASTNGSDLNSTFVFEPVNPELPTGIVKESKTSFILPKMPIKSNSGSGAYTKKFTPARSKLTGGNKENGVLKTKINPKFLCPTPARPKSVLTPRQVNIEHLKTPEIKVSINGYKMTKNKERIAQHNQHPYIRHIKLKRLGSTTPLSSEKKSKNLKL